MLKLALSVCSSFGALFGGEMPREMAPAFQAFWNTVSSPDPAWVQYYRGPTPNPYPYMQWAVPNHILSGRPIACRDRDSG